MWIKLSKQSYQQEQKKKYLSEKEDTTRDGINFLKAYRKQGIEQMGVGIHQQQKEKLDL